jgi:hypothetical protein
MSEETLFPMFDALLLELDDYHTTYDVAPDEPFNTFLYV